MPIGSHIQAWRLSRGLSVPTVAAKAGLPAHLLEAIEAGELDPSVSTLENLGSTLGIPTSWLFGDPKHLELLTADTDEDPPDPSDTDAVDPVMERILLGAHQERELYVLLTTLLQSGEPKLVKAAEASLRSLVKQSRQASVPWQVRPPGHFEPPTD